MDDAEEQASFSGSCSEYAHFETRLRAEPLALISSAVDFALGKQESIDATFCESEKGNLASRVWRKKVLAAKDNKNPRRTHWKLS